MSVILTHTHLGDDCDAAIANGTTGQPLVANTTGNPSFQTLPVVGGGTGATGVVSGLAGLGVVTAKIASDVTTTGQTLTNVTGMTFNIGANDTWQFQFMLRTGSSSAAGIEFGITLPTGATLLALFDGTTSGITAYSTDIMTASATAGIAFNTVNAQTGLVYITGTVIGDGTHSGAVQLTFLKVTSGTATIAANSTMLAVRMA